MSRWKEERHGRAPADVSFIRKTLLAGPKPVVCRRLSTARVSRARPKYAEVVAFLE